nr:diaminopimelate decarboxylase [bacterium]
MFWESDTMGVADNGHLMIGGCDAVELAKTYGTPLYVMDEARIRSNCRQFQLAFKELPMPARAYYASKAQSNLAIARLVYTEGMYMDCVSAGEMYTALQAGVPGQRLALHGNLKTRDELMMALENDVGQIIVDGFDDLTLLIELARAAGKKASILLRLRPGIDAHTHQSIQTATLDCKFGFSLYDGAAMKAVRMALEAQDCIELMGLHCHIGSQIFETQPYALAADSMCEFIAQIGRDTGTWLKTINLGGGFGVAYTPQDDPLPIAYMVRCAGEAVVQAASKHGLDYLPQIEFEPGRCIVGDAGVTLYTVGADKDVPGVRHYVALDGGMADNPRVALYGSVYTPLIANRVRDAADGHYALVGRCCESGDVLVKDACMPAPKVGEVVALMTTGAYHASMASQYNRLANPAAVLVKDGKARLISKRPTLDDIIAYDRLPEDL